ncbi:MAG TPA: DUF2163 domain-containing protein, partial [Streptosporangiaceae bacterium]|nr:DUF2163 domain-containing protein [Streptosporangiaceae bacterium]
AYYCGGDWDVTYGATTWSAGAATRGPYFDRRDTKARVSWKKGIEVDTLTFDVIPGAATLFGTGFLSACRMGLFDGADLTLGRAYMASYGPNQDIGPIGGPVVLFVGRVAEISLGRSYATFTVNSHLELLNQQFPRNLFQPGCINNLGDASCGVTLASFSANGTIQGGTTAGVLVTNVTFGTAYDLGKITMTSGALNGLSRSIRSGSGVNATLLGPFPAAPAPGDTFTAFQGCDKTLGANGCAKFSNTARYRGTPFIPPPETSV